MKKTVILILIFLLSTSIIFQFNNISTEATNNIDIELIEREKRNWEFVNHNAFATNYSPQNQINSDYVHMLELKWTYPFPPATEFLKYQEGGIAFEGAITPPLIVDGEVFVASNMRNVYSFEANSGDMNWINIYEHNWNKAKQELPEVAGGAPHIHGLQYINGNLFTSTLNCAVDAIDAKSGEISFSIQEICKNVEGNYYSWPMYEGIGKYGSPSHPGPIYEDENILVVAITGATASWGGGRAFIDGYDLNTNPPERLWRTFLSPPSEGDPEWALRECDKGWFFSYPEWKESGRMGIPCNEVPRENLKNDWGVPKHYNSAVGLLWGQMALDQETGIVYFGTGNQGGWVNNTYAIGPNLFASSIVAMNVTNGEMIWWYQTVPRDMVQADTAWNTVLTELNINGEKRKAIIKYSVTGLLWALDAATGEPLWIYESHLLESRVGEDGIPRGRTSGHPCIGCDPRTQDGYWNDVMSYYDMKEKKWLNYPSKDWFYIIPLRAGEADIAYNEKENIIILPLSLGWDASAKAGNHKGIGVPPGEYNLNYPKQKQNTTILGLDADTGEEIWSYFIDGVAYRGGIIATEDLAIIPAADGNLYILNGLTGELLHRIFLNTPLTTQPTIGRNSDGEFQIYIINGGRGRQEVGGLVHNQIPGSVMALGLSEKIGNIVEEEVEEEVEEMESEIINSTFLGIIIIIMVTIPVILLFRRR